MALTSLPEAARVPAKNWICILARYRVHNPRSGALEIAITVVPFAGLWAAIWASPQVSYSSTLGLAPFAAGLLVRLFFILHDCSHGASFRGRAGND